MENNIDKLFREKLYDRPIPYDQKSWKQASALLKKAPFDLNKSRNKTLRNSSILLMLLLSVGAVAYIYYSGAPLSNNEVSNDSNKAYIPEVLSASKYNNQEPSSKQQLFSIIDSTVIDKKDINETHTKSEKLSNEQIDKSENEILLNNMKRNGKNLSNQFVLDQMVSNTTIEADHYLRSEISTSNSTLSVTEVKKTEHSITEDKRNYININSLLSQAQYISNELPDIYIKMPISEQENTMVEISKKMKFNSYLLAGVGMNLNRSDGNIHLGLMGKYNLSRKFGISAGAIIDYSRLSQFRSVNENNYKVYGFASTLVTTKFVASDFYKLDIPLLLEYNYYRWNFGLGMGTEVLLGAYGAIISNTGDGDMKDGVWLDISKYQEKQSYYGLGQIGYHVNRSMSLSLKGQFYKKSDVSIAEIYNYSPYRFKFSLRLKLK